eukprot:TRINITY_DN47555_c0_g1_i1.p1 TRINITY_DN47555_c0_g1~~TRINITY_DN47555_c0_g1_i1.p1  ORF type:complete len:402 (+),score=42.30 TRINITY_DN47555_c0_g1_i1:220-1425(+)
MVIHMKLAFVGDVMLARGVDQILPHPCPPHLHEDYVKDARRYTALAVEKNGPLRLDRPPDYIWGDTIPVLRHENPEAFIINLETAITRAETWDRNKGIHYRMSPENAAIVLPAGRVSCVVLANNHAGDWGLDTGLAETLSVLERLRLPVAGAGQNAAEASRPAQTGQGGRVLVFGLAGMDAGTPYQWAATHARPGVAYTEDGFGAADVAALKKRVAAVKRAGDVAVLSVHWGSNWDLGVSTRHREFARRVVTECDIDLVHGHSSHHIRPVEVVAGRLVLYGCGDFVSDYEGIDFAQQGHADDAYRPGLGALWLPSLDEATGQLLRLRVVPLRNRRLSEERYTDATHPDILWVQRMLSRSLGRDERSGETAAGGLVVSTRVVDTDAGVSYVALDCVPHTAAH